MAKSEAVNGRGSELVLHVLALALALAHPCEAEGVELIGVGVRCVVVVHGVCCDSEYSALGDERPVAQSDVLHGLAHKRC